MTWRRATYPRTSRRPGFDRANRDKGTTNRTGRMRMSPCRRARKTRSVNDGWKRNRQHAGSRPVSGVAVAAAAQAMPVANGSPSPSRTSSDISLTIVRANTSRLSRFSSPKRLGGMSRRNERALRRGAGRATSRLTSPKSQTTRKRSRGEAALS